MKVVGSIKFYDKSILCFTLNIKNSELLFIGKKKQKNLVNGFLDSKNNIVIWDITKYQEENKISFSKYKKIKESEPKLGKTKILNIIPKKILNLPGNKTNETALNLSFNAKFNSFFVLYSSKLIIFETEEINLERKIHYIMINISNQIDLLDFWQIEYEYLIIQSKV